MARRRHRIPETGLPSGSSGCPPSEERQPFLHRGRKQMRELRLALKQKSSSIQTIDPPIHTSSLCIGKIDPSLCTYADIAKAAMHAANGGHGDLPPALGGRRVPRLMHRRDSRRLARNSFRAPASSRNLEACLSGQCTTSCLTTVSIRRKAVAFNRRGRGARGHHALSFTVGCRSRTLEISALIRAASA